MMTTLSTAVQAASNGEFLGVQWGSLAIVTVVTFVVTVIVVTFYSLGLRLLAVGLPADGSPGHRPVAATIGGWVCIAIGAAAVIYGVYLVIPAFHH